MDSILIKDIESLEKAFPNGIDELHYKIIIRLLYEEYSDRNLSELLSDFTHKPYAQVYNDVLGISQYDFSCTEISETKNILEKYNLLGD